MSLAEDEDEKYLVFKTDNLDVEDVIKIGKMFGVIKKKKTMLSEFEIRNIRGRYIEELDQIRNPDDRKKHLVAIAQLDLVLNE